MKINKNIPPSEPPLSKYLHMIGDRRGIPVSGTLELTPRCNFNCKMCYIHKYGVKKEDELSADTLLGIAREAKEAGTVFMLLTGGEPLIREDFRYIFHELKQMGMFVTVNTNGSLIDDEMLDFFRKDPPFRFNISLYGASDETYRRLCGNASFEKTVRNIKALRTAGISVRLNVALTPDNASDTDRLYELANELDVFIKAATYMYPPTRVTGESGTANARFTAAEAAHYMLLCREKLCTGEQVLKSLQDGEHGECFVQEESGIRCRAGRSSFWLTWDGRMLPCGMMNIRGENVASVGFNEAWRRTRELALSVQSPPECIACPRRAACPACAAACLAETGEFSVKPQYLCDYTNAAYEEAATRYK